MSELSANNYSREELFEIIDLSPSATDSEITAATDTIIQTYEVNGAKPNPQMANFIRDVQIRLLTPRQAIEEQIVGMNMNCHKENQSQCVSIHSQFRSNYFNTNSSDFTFDLSAVQNNVVALSIASLEIPRTYYTISSAIGNHIMVVLSTTTDEAWRVTIPDGNYDVTTMSPFDESVADINSALDVAVHGTVTHMDGAGTFTFSESGQGASALSTDGALVFAVDPRTHRSAFTTNGTASAICFNVDVDGHTETSTLIRFRLGWTLGFRGATYNLTSQQTITSTAVAFLSGARNWYISINDMQNQCSTPFIVAYHDWGVANHIISRVSVTHEPDQRIIRDHFSIPRRYSGPMNISQLQIKILDEYGRVVDLGDDDWSFVLEFEKLEMCWGV